MSYSIATEYDGNLFYECAERATRRENNPCVGRFVTVRNSDGSLNMDFYEARARRARSEAFAGFGRGILGFLRS